jgi:hypothetical protein
MAKFGKERLHFHIAPTPPTSAQATLDRLVSVGATRLDEDACPGAIGLADVDGNPLCLIEP